MSSPVAGLFVGLVAVALFLQKRRPGAYALGLAPAAVVAVSAWLFPFSGTQPMLFALDDPAALLVLGVFVFFLVPQASGRPYGSRRPCTASASSSSG
jgi:hypothetical protein